MFRVGKLVDAYSLIMVLLTLKIVVHWVKVSTMFSNFKFACKAFWVI